MEKPFYPGRTLARDLYGAARVYLEHLKVRMEPTTICLRSEITARAVLYEIAWPYDNEKSEFVGGTSAHEYARNLLVAAPEFLSSLLEEFYEDPTESSIEHLRHKTPAFMASARRVAADGTVGTVGNIAAAATIVFSCFDVLYAAQAFDLCRAVLAFDDIEKTPSALFYAVLTATLGYADRLPERETYLAKVEALLKERGQWHPYCLDGLRGAPKKDA